MASKQMRALLAAMLLTACSGSLVDHLNDFGTGTGTLPDGGGTNSCPGSFSACTGAACSPCASAPSGQTGQCLNNACVYTCEPPTLACSTGCCLPSQVAAGGKTSCAILEKKVSCWGAQPGTAAATSAAPVPVPGLSTVTQLAVGANHACVIDSDGVKCWGANDFGQLDGQPSGTLVPAPVTAVAGVSGATQIAVGLEHSCALNSTGVLCWGNNDFGQLGDGTPTPHTGVVQVPSTAGAATLSSGLSHACVTFLNGNILCWGADSLGQAGNGVAFGTAAAAPASLTFKGGSPGALFSISGESHSCAELASSFQCWGNDSAGQLGDGATANRSAPQKVDLGSISSAAGGGSHTCAVSGAVAATAGDDGTVSAGLYCWGSNANGQLGSGGLLPVAVGAAPVSFGSTTDTVQQLAAGTNHTCALLTSNQVWCWGDNSDGQVGIGSTAVTNVVLPRTVSGVVAQ
jgi:hypothetical protein